MRIYILYVSPLVYLCTLLLFTYICRSPYCCNISHMKCILSLSLVHIHIALFHFRFCCFIRGVVFGCPILTLLYGILLTLCHMISALGLAMMLMMSDATLFNKYSYSVVKYVNKQNKSYFFSILSLTVV